jgi:hypothetical protein
MSDQQVDSISKRQPVPTLSQYNKEEWFQLMEDWMTGEALFSAIDTSTTFSYATVTKEQTDAKARYWIRICISADDRDWIREKKTAKELWETLKLKYKDKLKVTGRQYLQQYTNYKLPEDTSIEKAWTNLGDLGRKMTASQPDLKSLATPEYRLQQLLQGLPVEYQTVRDAIDAQKNLDVVESLQILREKEALILQSQQGMKAQQYHASTPPPKDQKKTRSRQSPKHWKTRRQSDESPKQSREKLCYLCDGSHWTRNCPYTDAAKQAARQERRRRHTSKSQHRRQNAYPAEYDRPSSSSSSGSDTLAPEKEIAHVSEKTARLLQDDQKRRKLSPNRWIIDTGASSHMTDQKSLFRSSVKPYYKGYWVRVGGRSLEITGQGETKLETESGDSIKLLNTLYVPFLGANLLSASQLCKAGLRGAFDHKSLVMLDQDGSLVIHARKHGGVYVVEHIPKAFQNRAFSAEIHGQQSAFNSIPVQVQSSDHAPIQVNRPESDQKPELAYAGQHQTASTNVSQHQATLDHVGQRQAVLDNTSQHSAEPGSAGHYQAVSDGNGQYQAVVNSETQAASDRDQPMSDTDNLDNPTASNRQSYMLWHRRFAHLGHQKIRQLHHVTTLKKAIPITDRPSVCDVCAQTKIRNQTNREVRKRRDQVLDLVSIDIAGPFPASLTGNRYFLEVVDNYSRKVWVYPIKDQTGAIPVLRQWRVQAELETGNKVMAVRSDNAPELKELLEEWNVTSGVQPQYTEIHRSNQNGVAERAIQTTENSVRAMIKDANLPLEFWDEAARTDAYLRNRCDSGPPKDGQPRSPEEVWTGQQPSIDHIRVWGSKCFSYVDPKSLPAGGRRDKFMDRGRIGVFVGYEPTTTRQYRIYAPDLGYVTRSSVVRFVEDEPGGNIDLKLRIAKTGKAVEGVPRAALITPSTNNSGTPNVLPVRKPRGRPPKATVKESSIAQEVNLPDQEVESQPPEVIPDETQEEPHRELSQEPVPATAPPQARTFSHVEIVRKRPRSDSDYLIIPDAKQIKAMMAMIATEGCETVHSVKYRVLIPKSYDAAIRDAIYGYQWQQAIKREINALLVNQTWEERVPPERANIVSSRWVFDVKYTPTSEIEKFKARLVARGFSQVQGLDFDETFAPTVRIDSLRLLLAIVALEDLECHQIDINNAFTESKLKEEIYMAPPPGIEVKPGCVLKIQRSLYGLKQAARDWNETCKAAILNLGFRQAYADPCIFMHKSGVILGVYVDDIVVAAKRLPDVNWFKSEFGALFKIKDLMEIKRILGIRVTRNRAERWIELDQQGYIEKFLHEDGMLQDRQRPVTTPINGYSQLRPTEPTDTRTDRTKYQRRTGNCLYAMIHTRPDIAFAIGKLSQHMSDPATHHHSGIMHLQRYLRATAATRIRYGRTQTRSDNVGQHQLPHVLGFADADYAADISDRKSTLGYVFTFAGGAISWRSTKQRSVATSTTEAEYMATSTAAKHAIWIQQLLRDMGYEKYIGSNGYSTELRNDNESAIHLAHNPRIHERSKHIDIAYHHVRDLMLKKRILLNYTSTQSMLADGLTKPLAGQLFTTFFDKLGLLCS